MNPSLFGPRFTLRVLFAALVFIWLAPSALAQFPSAVNNDTRTPVPGSGHDFIHMLSETVDPSSGSLSVHISTPVPPSRGITIPFSFDYSSGAVKQAQVCSTSGSSAYGCFAVSNVAGVVAESGGWSYSIPQLTANQAQAICYINGGGGRTLTTDVVFDYIFTDPSGMRHNLGLAHTPTLQPDCSYVWNPEPYSVSVGGDDFYQAILNQTTGAVTVVSADGTVYNFTANTFGGGFLVTGWLPSTIEDRNGNIVTISEGGSGNITEKDTAGRTAVSTSAPVGTNGTVSISGLPNVYTVTWETISSVYGSQYEQLGNGSNDGCNWTGNGGANISVIKSIELPNGTYYTFAYDSYGLLNQITYPTGAVVNYTRAIPSSPNGLLAFFPPYPNNQYGCSYAYYAPMVTQRTVKFDGTHTALVQNFSYTTAYNAGVEQATVQTTVYSSDGTTNLGTFKTVYNYFGAYFPISDPDDQVTAATATPVEQTVQYYDYGQTNLLETVTKGWQDQFLLGCQLDTHDGSGLRGTFFSYGAGGVVTDKKEYDYGQITGTSECPQAPEGGPITAPSSPAPLRETVATYQSFADTPIYPSGPSIFDRPATVKTYLNGAASGTLEAETDHFYDEFSVSGETATDHDETNYGPSSTAPRGNATDIRRQCFPTSICPSGPGLGPDTSYIYDETGQPTSIIDPNGNTTQYSYADSYTSGTPPGNTNAYLTKVTQPTTNGVAHIESYSYSYADAQLTKLTDQNNQVTTYTYNTPPSGCSYGDGLDRLSKIAYPDGGQTTYCYNNAAPNPTITTTKAMNSSQSIVTVDVMDGLGHQTNKQLSDPQGTISENYLTLDGMGHTYHQYNPYRSTSDPTYGYTSYLYDGLGRTTKVTKPDSSVVTTTYCSQDTLVTDEAGHWRRSTTDGLGRLIEVDEPNSTTATVTACPAQNDPIWKTTYANDTLDDLTAVVQGGSHNRSFTYNSLKQLTQSVNPETGTIKYTYDANGNVTTKIDGRSITTNYSPTSSPIDALNRVTQITYSDGMTPTVSYTYDQSACLGQSSCYNIGHRTTMTDAGGTENLAYDKMGRELIEQRTTNSITKNTTYTYDLAGDLATLTYPSGRIITYTYDSAGRPSDAVDKTNSINYAVGSCANGAASPTTGACYAPQGALSQLKNGTNLVSTYLFNTRLQPCWMYATTGTALATSTLCTASDPGPGNILDLQYNFNSGHDNGNVIGITNKRDSTRTQSFAYDQVNRIASGQTSSTSGSNCWGETYTLDQWANLTAIGALSGYTGCTQDNLSISVNGNNQLSPSPQFSYDAAGNLTFAGGGSYTYNAESELVQSGVNTEAGYVYEGDGNRLEKTNGVQPTKIYWYGAGTEILDESDPNGNFSNEYVFFGGKRIAMRTVSSGTIYYYEEDMLGSSRTMVQAGQTSFCFDADFLPFGYEKDVTTTCTQNYKFEGKERDTETNNDDFGARYYSSQYGRWLSADWSSVPAPVPYANLTNPQTLNLYAMVSDNPESFADLDGHTQVCSGTTYSRDGHGNIVVHANCTDVPDFHRPSKRTLNLKQDIVTPGHGHGITCQTACQAAWLKLGADLTVMAGLFSDDPALEDEGGDLELEAEKLLRKAAAEAEAEETAAPEPAPSSETTPTTDPSKFRPVRGTKGKENVDTGEIYERDMFHKNHYEVYKNRKMYEKGIRDRSVWEDGRLKEKF